MTSSTEIDRSFNALMPILAVRDRPVALLGMMGAGKSTITRQLASLSGLGYIDSDREISKRLEAEFGMNIPLFFADHGEAAFRTIERECIQKTLKQGAMFLALGGGAFINPTVRSVLLKRADCVYLDVPKEILWKRISHRISKRPMLDTDNPRATFDALYQQRAPIYAQAPIHVQVTTNHQMDTVALVKKALWAHIKGNT